MSGVTITCLIHSRNPKQRTGDKIIPNSTLILSSVAIKITVFIIVPSPESCLAYLLPTQIYKEKVFFCAGETLTPKPELISIRALMLFTGDRQNTIHQSLLCSLSLLSVTVFTFLSLDCPSLTSTFFFFFFFYFLPVHLSRGHSCLPSFLPSFLLPTVPSLSTSFLSDTPLSP